MHKQLSSYLKKQFFIMDIKGGLTMCLLGPSPRYCTRELVYLEIIPNRTENQSLSGLEFIELVSNIEDEMRKADIMDETGSDDTETSDTG